MLSSIQTNITIYLIKLVNKTFLLNYKTQLVCQKYGQTNDQKYNLTITFFPEVMLIINDKTQYHICYSHFLSDLFCHTQIYCYKQTGPYTFVYEMKKLICMVYSLENSDWFSTNGTCFTVSLAYWKLCAIQPGTFYSGKVVRLLRWELMLMGASTQNLPWALKFLLAALMMIYKVCYRSKSLQIQFTGRIIYCLCLKQDNKDYLILLLSIMVRYALHNGEVRSRYRCLILRAK